MQISLHLLVQNYPFFGFIFTLSCGVHGGSFCFLICVVFGDVQLFLVFSHNLL
jgi:hypothetical protein